MIILISQYLLEFAFFIVTEGEVDEFIVAFNEITQRHSCAVA